MTKITGLFLEDVMYTASLINNKTNEL